MTKLEAAREGLDYGWRGVARRWEIARDSWSDQQAARFETQYVEPQTAQIVRTLDALDALIEVVNAARRELK